MRSAILVASMACGAVAFQAPIGLSGFRGAAIAEPTCDQTTRVARGLRTLVADGKSNVLRDRIKTVKNTKKITEAMRLVAAAKVRRAQDAVLKCRPFSQELQKLFGSLIYQLDKEDIDLPLLEEREVKKVTVVGISGDRGLCGAYNSYAIKKIEKRVKELLAQGIEVDIVPIGKKVTQYFRRREQYNIKASFNCGQAPSAAEASTIAEDLLADYLSGETDSVELIYTRFVTLISSEPAIRTLLPVKLRGIEAEGDELFQLTSAGGKFSVDRKEGEAGEEVAGFDQDIIFEQDPVQIVNAILPLYLNGQLLRALQEAVASELAARMTAMASASDNAGELASKLSLQYNRARQASVTQELLEIVAGAACASG